MNKSKNDEFMNQDIVISSLWMVAVWKSHLLLLSFSVTLLLKFIIETLKFPHD